MGVDEFREDERGEEYGAIAGLINFVRLLTLFVALIIWSVLGFIFWIPMMVYAIMRFSALVVYATIVDADPKALGAHLERSVRFYLQGFRNIIRAIKGKQRLALDRGDVFQVEAGVIIGHLLWTLFFWVAAVVLVLWLFGAFTSADTSDRSPSATPTAPRKSGSR